MANDAVGEPMSLNRYSYVAGNPINFVDPSGMIAETPGQWNSCYRQDDPCAVYPGWTRDIRGEAFSGILACTNFRTLKSDSYMVLPSELQRWWPGLSPTEQEIEEALAATNTEQCRSNAKFDHIPQHTFAFVSEWLSSNASEISDVADKLRVDPALVAGLLASEMLFDYGLKDKASDLSARLGRATSGFGGYGYANAHEETRQYANDYLQQFIESGTVFPVYPIGDADPKWLTMDYGAILTTAVIARWLVDPYTSQVDVGYATANVLTAEDMAVIFTAYRAGVGGWSPPSDTYAFDSVREYRERLSDPGLPCNAQLALPVMRYTKTIFP
jgi:hypothetical protein